MQGGRLIVYTDYIAPACYLAEAPLDALRSDGVAVEYRAFELFPTPLPLPDYGSAEEAAAWQERVAPLAARLGVPLERPRRAVRTRKAHEAVLLAAAHGRGEAMHRAVQRAYFVEGLDIARVDVLVRLGVEQGLDRSELKVTLDLDTYADAVAASRDAALRAGIEGAPAFVSERDGRRRALVGWHDTAALRSWLEAGAAGRRET